MMMYSILMIIGVIFVITVSYTIYRLYQANKAHIAQITDIQNQLTILTSGTVGTDERLFEFERKLVALTEKQSDLGSGLPSRHNYDQAIRLAKKGAAISQLIDNCNLTDEEAHLITKMYGQHTGTH